MLRENNLRVALDFLACGLDPGSAALFLQSDVPAVPGLPWILARLTPMGLLERSHSYKDKLARGASPSAGLFTYPVLMAADILIYDSDVVPVGKDQKQHLEMTRDIAVKMNEPSGNSSAARSRGSTRRPKWCPGLDGQKMQELREHDRDFRRRKGNAKTGHEHRDRSDGWSKR